MNKLVLLFLIITQLYAGDYRSGKTLYFTKGCNGCHGFSAEGMNEYPRLANRAKGFLTHRLKKYRSKESPSQQAQLMIPFALNLNDEDIDNITTYLNELIEDNKDKYILDYSVEGDGGS
ncbi:MAG: c-type cytochrome [Campylobacterota bacterium]|nr:c-type cytochrome [Campylobacterota bacterium]